MTATTTDVGPVGGLSSGGFGSAVRAEWVKFRTVPGWSVALVMSVILCVVFTYLVANGNRTGTCGGNGACTSGHAFVPTDRGGGEQADIHGRRQSVAAWAGLGILCIYSAVALAAATLLLIRRDA